MKRKVPALAAFLNLILPGVGYIYVGNRIVFGILLLVAGLIAIYAVWPYEFSGLEWVASLIFAVAFAIDGWSEAAKHNKSVV